MFPPDEYCAPPSSALFCTEVTVDGREECREFGNLWDHFTECAAAAIDTAKYTYGTGMRRISLEQYAAAYKLHTGRTLEREAVEHGFKRALRIFFEKCPSSNSLTQTGFSTSSATIGSRSRRNNRS